MRYLLAFLLLVLAAGCDFLPARLQRAAFDPGTFRFVPTGKDGIIGAMMGRTLEFTTSGRVISNRLGMEVVGSYSVEAPYVYMKESGQEVRFTLVGHDTIVPPALWGGYYVRGEASTTP